MFSAEMIEAFLPAWATATANPGRSLALRVMAPYRYFGPQGITSYG